MPTTPIALKAGDYEDDEPASSGSGAVALAPGDYEDDTPPPINPYANWRERRDVGQQLTNLSRGPGSTDPYYDPTAGPPSLLPAPKQRPLSPAEEAFSQEENTGQYVRPGQPAPRTNIEANRQVLNPPAPVLVPSRLAGPATAAQIAQEPGAHPVEPLKTLGSSYLNAALLSGEDLGRFPMATRGQREQIDAAQAERPTGLAAGPRLAGRQIVKGMEDIREPLEEHGAQYREPGEAVQAGEPLPDYGTRKGVDTPRMFKGGTEVLQGAMTLGTPAFAAGVAEAPIQAGLNYLGGVATGKAAQFAAKEAGLSPEGQEFFNVVGFFGLNALTAATGLRGAINPLVGREAVPGTVRPLWEPGTERPMVDPKTGQPPIDPATGKVAIDPQTGKPWTTGEPMRDEAGNVMRDPATGQWVDKRFPGAVIGGRGFAAGVGRDPTGGWQGTVRVGPYEASFGRRGSGAPRPGAPPPEAAPPDGATIQAHAQLQTVTEVATRAAETQQQAAQVAGMAPPPPPPPKPGEAGSGQPPLPAGMDNGHLSQQTVSYAARAIQMLPPALRPQAIRQAVAKLADWMFKSKTVVGPDDKVVNVDSPKAAQTEAIKVINDGVDREAEAGKAQAKAKEDAAKQAEKIRKEQEKDQETAAQEREDALKATTAKQQPSQVPDTPLTRIIKAALQAHPEPATEEKLNRLVGTFPVVPADTRKALVQEELTRRGNLVEDQGQANLTGQAPAPGKSREELHRLAQEMVAGNHPYMVVPPGSNYKPEIATDKQSAFTKTQVKHSPDPELNGDFYHPKTIKNSEIRAAAESDNPRAALAEIEKKWRKQNPTELQSGDFEEEPVTETKPPVTETTAPITETKLPEAGKKPVIKEPTGNKITALPRDLAGSKPRYGYQDKNFELEFEDPRDLAAYTLSQKTPNKRHDDFLKYYQSQFPGKGRDWLENHATEVRDEIWEAAKDGNPADGPIKVPSIAKDLEPAEKPEDEEPPEKPEDEEEPEQITPPAQKPVTPQVTPIKGMKPLGANPFADRTKPGAGDMKLTQDWGTEINGYSNDPMREEGSEVKDKFLGETRKYLNAVSTELIAAGFKPHIDKKGKEIKPVYVNDAGPAVSGDVSLSLLGPDDKGIYVSIGANHVQGAPATKNGVNIMYRAASEKDRFGGGMKSPNQWAPVNLTASELAQRLMKHVGVEAGKPTEPAKQPWEMTPQEYKAAFPNKAERAPKTINEAVAALEAGATAADLVEKYSQKELKAIAFVMNAPAYGTKIVLAYRLVDTWKLRKTLSKETEESLQEKYKAAELKEMVRQIGGYLGANKAGQAGQLIHWRNQSRTAAQDRLADWNHWLEVSKAHEEGKKIPQENIDLYRLEEKPETPEAEAAAETAGYLVAPVDKIGSSYVVLDSRAGNRTVATGFATRKEAEGWITTRKIEENPEKWQDILQAENEANLAKPGAFPAFKVGDKVSFKDFAGAETEGKIIEIQATHAMIRYAPDRPPMRVPLDKIKPAAKPEAEQKAPAAPPAKTYQYELHVEGKWRAIDTVFATKEEAEQAGQNHLDRWTMVNDVRVIPSDKPATYRWNKEEGKSERIPEKLAEPEAAPVKPAAPPQEEKVAPEEEPSEPIVPTEEKPAVIEAQQEGATPAPAVNDLVDTLYRKIAAGQALGNVTELNKIAESVLGAGRTSGAWTPKDVFDAMEAAINRHLIEQGARLLAMDPHEALAELRDLMSRVTSQGVRTEEQIKLQQFSTPPTESYVAALVAALKPTDVSLEPSAGNGGLALWPKSIGATVHVNEISPRRREMLRTIGFAQAVSASEGAKILMGGGILPNELEITAHDGEIINALLDPSIQPTVILMNPPFSASDQKSHEAKNRSLYGFNHVDSALQRLAKGGRLVAILGGGQANEPNGGASLFGGASGKWFEKVAKQYNVRANIRISGREYQKYGTSFATRIIVIDKDGPTKSLADVVQGNFDTLEEAYDALRPVAESRPEIAPAGPRSQTGIRQGQSGTGVAAGGDTGVSVRGEPRGTGLQDGEGTGPGNGLRGSGRNPATNGPGGGNQSTPLHPAGSEPAGHPPSGPGAGAGGSYPDLHGERPDAAPIPGLEAGAVTGIDLERVENQATPEEEDSAAFVAYRPTLKGPEHPGAIVESKTMATVPIPEITYKPSLAMPLESGKLSAVQLEAVAMAGAQNDIILPSGARASMLIGDGTGVGKGREGAAIAHDNWAKGRRRIMWVTKTWDLLPDAIRDLKGIGSELATKVIGLQDFDAKDVLDHQGVIVTTYGLMRSADKKGNTRFAQIDRWLRGQDDGDTAYMLFDESHNLKNAVVGQGGQASQVGVGTKKLIDEMPKLRLTSMSATAASDVMNLGYLADRLGLCGAGTAFPTGFNQFASAIAGGGMSALEMIARELKAQGKYVARTLSFKGCTYDTVHATLTPDQRAVYRSATRAWRSVVQRAEATITNSTNGGAFQKSRFMALFYSAQLRFFSVLLTSLKIPAMIERAQQDLKDGKSVVITLINTNEAAQDREKTRAATAKAEDPDDILEYDFGPSEMLIQLVRDNYPVQQFRDDVDENGKPVKVAVYTTDSDGHPIPALNPQAVAERDALMAELKRDLRMPGNPLDILIEALGGPNKVAELTGRKEYFDEAKQEFVPRGGKDVPRKKVNQVEMKRFQDGEKRVAVLSSAADTGISLHADNNAKNKQKRSHYTLQPGWSADKAMQMLGRTNRTNQAHAPEYHMVESDMAGEKRFIATITRRLGSLNAISKGQKTAGAGASAEAMDKVNFESEQGRQATDLFYRQLLRNMAIPGAYANEPGPDGVVTQTQLRGLRILDELSVLKDDPNAGKTVPTADRTNVTKLLNRLMALDPDLQQPVYDYYYDLFNAIVQQAEADGTLDTGVKTLPGDTFSIKESRTVANDPHTKAATDYYKVEAKSPTHRVSPEEFDKRMKGKAGDPDPVVMRNKKTGQLLIARAARDIVHADGTATPAAHISTPAAGAWAKVPQNDIAQRFESVAEHAKGEVAKAEEQVRRAEQYLESAKRYATNIPDMDERLKAKEEEYRTATYSYTRDRLQHELQTLRQRRQNADAAVVREKEEQDRLQANIDKAKRDLEAAKDRENSLDEQTRDEWEKQYNGAPAFRTQEYHLVGGAVMRWWNPIREAVRGSLKIYTTVDSDTGKRVVGIEIEPSQITPLLDRMAGGGSTVTRAQLETDVLRNGTEYKLEGGIRVTRGRVGRDFVIRLTPPTEAIATHLKQLGVLYERGVQPMYYLPTPEYDDKGSEKNNASKVINSVLKEYPPVSDAPSAAAPTQANRMPRGNATFSMLGTGHLDVPAKAVAAYAGKAAKATWKEAITAAKATGKSAKTIGRELVGWLYPTALASTKALDIMGKATGEPAMRSFEAGQLMHGISKMFDAMTPEEWTDFIDAKENGRDQDSPDLQKAQDLIDSILEAQRERENEAVNLGKPDVDLERFSEDVDEGLSNKELAERHGISWQQARAWRKQLANGEEIDQGRIELTDKPGYFPHRWEVGPNAEEVPSEDEQIEALGKPVRQGTGRRPFEGSKAFMKQQTWGYRDAIEAGAKPIGSPVKQVMQRLQEGAKFVAARYAWHNLKGAGLALFLKRGRPLPVGYRYVDDKSANVWRMVQSTELTDEGVNRLYPVETGRWIVQSDAARLLNNYLSEDSIRGSEAGRALIKLKNVSTNIRLSWSAFHWGFITAETFSAALQVGLDKLYNRGWRDLDSDAAKEGLADIGRSMVAPYTAIKMGGQLIQYARNAQEFLASPEGKKFIERYPDAYRLMQLLHQGEMRWDLDKTFRGSFGDHCIEAWKAGELGKALGKTLPWLAEMVARPLFEHYIPRAKWTFAVQLLASKLEQYSAALADGSKTEVEIAREVAQMSDNFFGEVNWDSLYLRNTMRTATQLTFRSATWKGGSWRAAVQAGNEQFSSRAFDDHMVDNMKDQSRKWDWARQYTSRMPQMGANAGRLLATALFVGITGSILSKIFSKKWPWQWAKEAKNNHGVWANAALEAMHFRTGQVDAHGEPVRFSFPTGLKEYEHAPEDPWRYLKGAQSDWLSNAIDSLGNEDAYGNYIYDPNDPIYTKFGMGLLYNIKGDFTPMSVANWKRTYGSQDFLSKAPRATGMIGGAPKSLDRSAALQEAISLEHHQAHTPAQQQEWEYARSAPPTRHDLLKAHREKDMDYLEKLVMKMSYTDAMKVYEKATPEEKKDLNRIIYKKRVNMIKAGRGR